MIRDSTAGVPALYSLFPWCVPSESFRAAIGRLPNDAAAVVLMGGPGGPSSDGFILRTGTTAMADEMAESLRGAVECQLRDQAHQIYWSVGNRIRQMMALHEGQAAVDPAGPHADFVRELDALKERLLRASFVASRAESFREAVRKVRDHDVAIGLRNDQVAAYGAADDDPIFVED